MYYLDANGEKQDRELREELLPEHAGRQLNEIQQITRRRGDTILARTTILIKFRRAMLETLRRRRPESPDPCPRPGRRVH